MIKSLRLPAVRWNGHRSLFLITSTPLHRQTTRKIRSYAALDPFNTDILIIDATNVLCRASADAAREDKTTKELFADWLAFLLAICHPRLSVAVFDTGNANGRWRVQLNPSYQKRRRQQLPNNPPSQKATSTAHHQFSPTIQNLGGISFEAPIGYEADDLITALCTHLVDTTTPDTSITIASGDGDMQQNINERIQWLKILDLPTAASPAGVELATHASFLEQYKFQPSLYGQYLALTGKKEAGIGGIGISSSSAAQLLKTFGGIDKAMEAAEQGRMKGWAPKVVAALTSTDKIAQLKKNMKILGGGRDLRDSTAKNILEPAMRKVIDNAVSTRLTNEKNQPTEEISDCSASSIAWLLPMHVQRWRQCESSIRHIADYLQKQGHDVVLKTSTSSGLPVDILLAKKKLALFVCQINKKKSISSSIRAAKEMSSSKSDTTTENIHDDDGMYSLAGQLTQLSDVLNNTDTGDNTSNKAAVKQVSNAMQHHINLVKRSGLKPFVILIPSAALL